MTAYVARRLLLVPVTLVIVTAVVFGLSHLSGDLVAIIAGPDASPEQRAALVRELHLDEPAPQQYLRFVASAVRGDLGESFYYKRSALEVVAERLPATVELALAGMLLAVVLGVSLGVLAAVNADRRSDLAITSLAVLGQSVPSFWLGLLLILLFSVDLHWLPTSGRGDPAQLIMPAVTVAAFVLPQIVLLTRTSMLEVLRESYITVAVAKGLRTRVVVLRHALRNALTTVIAAIGVQWATLMGGAVITETVFSWPGVGRLSVEAIFNRDVPVIEAAVLVLAISVMLTNIVVDVLIAAADPRIRVHG